MKGKLLFTLVLTVVLGLGWSSAWAEFPNNPTWTTVLVSGSVYDETIAGDMEGLTGDNDGRFYVADRQTNRNVWEIDTNTVPASITKVGEVGSGASNPSGLTFDANGDLFITSGSSIYKLTPNADSPPTASVYADGVPGANGVAFLCNDLFVTDGTQNQGRVWKITGSGANCTPGSEVNCEEFLRIQPRRNSPALGGNVPTDSSRPDGVGSVRYTVPNHQTSAPSATHRQDIVANGVAFSVNGKTMFIADTSRGAIWAAELKGNGDLKSDTGCDPTFHPNTLCMDSLYVAHPLLEGVDGIALLKNGTILASVNERNAIVAVSKKREVVDVFQNAPDPTTLLRNGRTDDPNAPLEFPTSPFVSGKTFCTTCADSPRRDNNPDDEGEGSKVICLDQDLQVDGLPLPVH